MSRASRRWALIALAAAVLGGAATLVPASPAYAATWSTITTPNATADRNQLNGIDAIDTSEAWAAGYAIHPTTPRSRPLPARWNGIAWSLQTTPALTGDAAFNAVDGDSSGNVWAVGAVGPATLTERWNGSAWSVVASPSPADATGARLRGVKSLAPDNAWAVGDSSHASGVVRTMIQHWNGTNWSIVASPSPDLHQNLLRAVDGIAADDLWAVGGLGTDGYSGEPVGSVVLHWNGTAWSQVTIPGSGGAFSITELNDVVALAANDVWAVGRGFSFQYFQEVPYLLHYNGVTWQHSTIPGGPFGRFNAITAASATLVYAVGTGNGALVARWNGSVWSQESLPGTGYRNFLAASTAGAGTVWAAGMQAGGDFVFRTLAARGTGA